MNHADRTERIMFRSVAVVISMAALVLSSAEESRWPAAVTPAVALLTYWVVDRRRLIRLPVIAANLLGVIAFLVAAWEFRDGTLLTKLLAGAHLLTYMTWVVLLMQKGNRQIWWLLALAVLQLSVASVLTNSPSFGAALVVMLLMMIWTLTVFSVYRAQLRVGGGRGSEDSLAANQSASATLRPVVEHGLQVDSRDSWFGWRFYGMTLFSFVASLVLSIIAFAVFPRFWTSQPLAALQSIRQSLPQQTGFTETVELGDIGEIMQSNERVLQFHITDMRTGADIDPQRFAEVMNMDEVLFRGNALGQYDKGRWQPARRQRSRTARFVRTGQGQQFDNTPANSDYRIRITQDPPIGQFAFAPVPIKNAFYRGRLDGLHQRDFTYSLVHTINDRRKRAEPVTYEVWCARPKKDARDHSPANESRAGRSDLSLSDLKRLGGEFFPPDLLQARAWCITHDLKTELPQLWQLAQQLCTENGTLVSHEERIRRVHTFLTSSGGFRYTLVAAVDNPSLDPIEDFLVNRRAGHCEYFASAGALMLQAVEVPARVVNGYKGCERNSVTKTWEVRQKHAHTWVEAYVNGSWITMDPTPSARDDSVSQEDAFAWWTDLQTAMNDAWYMMVQQMNLERQEQLARPMLESARQTWKNVREKGLWTSIKIFFVEFVLKPDRWFSWQFWVVSFIGLLIPGLILQQRPDRALMTLLSRLLGLFRAENRNQRHVVRFYENFCHLCAEHGLVFPAHQTALENARMAARQFQDVLQTEEDRELPIGIAATFNSVRFGHKVLSTESVTQIRMAVTRFADILKRRKSGNAGVEQAGESSSRRPDRRLSDGEHGAGHQNCGSTV